MFKLQTTPYVPGRVRGFVRFGRTAATRDGLVVVTQQELVNFEGPCCGLIVIDGRPFSQSMVRVLGHAMPTVIATPEQVAHLKDGAELVLDGASGLLIDPALLEIMPPAGVNEPPELFTALQTQDQKSITLRAEAGNRVGVMRSVSSGARGITLRMELIGSKGRTPPGAEFFINEMGICGHESEPLPLTLTLPDITAEKLPLWCADMADQLKGSATRGLRLYSQEPFRSVIFSILEGIAQASEFYDMRVMLPYVTHLEEFRTWRKEIENACSVPITLGALLETPSAVMMVNEFLDEADFVVINTDELMESLFAAPGDGAAWIDPYSPAVYRLLQQIAKSADYRTGEIQLSGQLSRMPGVLPVLIGMGYRIISTDPLYVAPLAKMIPEINGEEAESLAEAVCRASDAESVKLALGIATKSESV